jgi:hypothetical protein
MTVKRTLNRIRLDKIAAVDSPCQEHATVAIVKRRPGAKDTTPKGIAKATFGEALQANMTADAVNDAFYESFDGLWERNDAFKTALTDELAAGGDGTTASAAYVASVKQLVDDAVAEARQAGATATNTDPVDKALNAAVNKWLELEEEQTTMKITTKAELQAAVAKFNPQTTPVADVLVIQKAAKDLAAEDALPAEGPLAVAKADPAVATLQREIAVLKLSPESRKHYDALDEAGQTSFIGKSETDQADEIAKANSTDPVVYKCKDGMEIRKSDGAAAAVLAKRADEQADELAKLRGDLSGSTIEKRAAEKYPHIAKAVAVEMLTSVEKLGDDSVAGKAVLASLDTMEKSGGRLFKTIGRDEGGSETGGGDLQKARATWDGEVAKIKARDNIDTASAMSKARVEFADLWKEAFPDTAEIVEAHEVDQAAAG